MSIVKDVTFVSLTVFSLFNKTGGCLSDEYIEFDQWKNSGSFVQYERAKSPIGRFLGIFWGLTPAKSFQVGAKYEL